MFSTFGLSNDAIPPKNKKKNKAVPISNFEYPCAFHKNGSKIEQDVVTKDFNTAIVFRIFNFLLERISINACFRFILIFFCFSIRKFRNHSEHQ